MEETLFSAQRPSQKNNLFLFMSIFPQTFFTFVGCHFMSFTLFSTRHGNKIFKVNKLLFNTIFFLCILHCLSLIVKILLQV